MKLLKNTFALMAVACSLFAVSSVRAEAGYDKGFYIKSDDGDFKLKIEGQLQGQYQLFLGEDQDAVHTFQIRRGRLTFKGHAFEKVGFKFQLEAVGGKVTVNSDGLTASGPNLRDAYLDYKFSDAAVLRFGQFKPWWNREELTSSSKQQFVDRSLQNDVFTLGRDLGVSLHGSVADNALEYGISITNEGKNRNALNNNQELLFAGRLVWNAMGKHGYSMSDLKRSEESQLALGLAFFYNKPTDAGEDDLIGFSLDAAYKYAGFSLHVEGNFARNLDDEINIFGFLAQAGYMFNDHLELAVRGAAVIQPEDNFENGYEVGASINYFIKGHRLKFQLDYGLFVNSPYTGGDLNNFVTEGVYSNFVDGVTDHRIRAAMQLVF